MKQHVVKNTLLLFPFLVLVILVATACSSLPSQTYDDGVSDEEYIQIASVTEEARAFLNDYPNAEIYVDRSSKLAVDFRVNKVTPVSTTQSWEGIRLRVFIDPKTKQAADAFIDCKDRSGKQNFVEEELKAYLEKYVEDESCP